MLPELGGVTTLPELGEAPPKLKDVPFVTMTAAEAAPLDSAAKTRAQVASERNMTCLPVGRPRKWGSVTGIYPGILPSDAGRRCGLVNRGTNFSSMHHAGGVQDANWSSLIAPGCVITECPRPVTSHRASGSSEAGRVTRAVRHRGCLYCLYTRGRIVPSAHERRRLQRRPVMTLDKRPCRRR